MNIFVIETNTVILALNIDTVGQKNIKYELGEG
jgi:hypothetical protein